MPFQKLSPTLLREHKGVSFTGIATLFFCHDGRGKIFLTKRSKNARDEHGRWSPGAGGLKHGQSIEENMLRELKEEHNIEPLKTDFIGYFDVFRTLPHNLQTHWLAMCFAVQVDPAKIQINEPDMVDDYGWFDPNNLPSPKHSQFDLFMDVLGDRLKLYVKSHDH